MGFLDDKREEMAARLDELRPTVEEFHRLEAAVAALDDVDADPVLAPQPSKRTRRARPASSQRGRPRGSGTRGKQALALIQGHPGITIPEMAGEMSIQQNYLYRVLPGLREDGLVRKDGRGWYPA